MSKPWDLDEEVFHEPDAEEMKIRRHKERNKKQKMIIGKRLTNGSGLTTIADFTDQNHPMKNCIRFSWRACKN